MTKLIELEQRLRDEPDNLGLRVLLASALQAAGRREDSIELYRSVALAYRDQGRIQQAIAVCHSVLVFAPEDERCQQLLAALAMRPVFAVQSASIERAQTRDGENSDERPDEHGEHAIDRLTPPRLPRPPLPGAASDDREPEPEADGIPEAEPDADSEIGRRSFGDVTPLPAPLPYHLADPVTAPVVVAAADRLPTFSEEMAQQPKLAGIASAARQISAQLIAATRAAREADDQDVSGELETRRLPRITADDLRKISGPPPAFLTGSMAIPEPIDSDDEPTLLPTGDAVLRAEPEDEATEPRELPIRGRVSSGPPMARTGPLASPFFLPVPPRNRVAVLQRFRRKIAASGSVVIRRGETGHGLVIVVRGLLELHGDRADGMRVVLGAIAPGEYIGEASLLGRAPAALDVVAAVDSELMVLGDADFHEIAAAYSGLRSELKHVAERRARDHEQRLAAGAR